MAIAYIWLFRILFVVSLLANGFFLVGKGIAITNEYNNHQNQQQAQVVVNTTNFQGAVTWKAEKKGNIEAFLNSLAPEQALFSKISGNTVYFPDFHKTEEDLAITIPNPEANHLK